MRESRGRRGRDVIEGMRAKATRERVIQRLYEMALARANDAVKLAYCQEPTEDETDGWTSVRWRSSAAQPRERGDPVHRPGEGIAALAGMLEGEGCEAEEFFRAMVQTEEEA